MHRNLTVKTFNLVRRSKPLLSSRHKYLRLDKNERVSNFSKNFINLFKKKLNSESLNTYPEIYEFYKLLSKNHKLKKNQFLGTAGIDTGLKNSIEIFGHKKIIILDPTFAMINVYCKILGKKVIKIGYDKNLNLQFKKLEKNINKQVSLIILSNPNSPTGTVLDLKNIKKILVKAAKYNINVVIDEAYYGFSTVTAEPLIKRYKNLIILRTFSKAYGLAGLRVGYIISTSKNIKLYNNIKPMYEVNSLGILAANILLKNQSIKKKYLKEVKEGKKILLNFFLKKNIYFLKSEGNFILFRLKKNKNNYFSLFKQNKIMIVEKLNHINLTGLSRITLAPKKEILKFIKILKNY